MLSRKEIQRIIEMRKKGKSKAAIARKNGHTRTAVDASKAIQVRE